MPAGTPDLVVASATRGTPDVAVSGPYATQTGVHVDDLADAPATSTVGAAGLLEDAADLADVQTALAEVIADVNQERAKLRAVMDVLRQSGLMT